MNPGISYGYFKWLNADSLTSITCHIVLQAENVQVTNNINVPFWWAIRYFSNKMTKRSPAPNTLCIGWNKNPYSIIGKAKWTHRSNPDSLKAHLPDAIQLPLLSLFKNNNKKMGTSAHCVHEHHVHAAVSCYHMPMPPGPEAQRPLQQHQCTPFCSWALFQLPVCPGSGYEAQLLLPEHIHASNHTCLLKKTDYPNHYHYSFKSERQRDLFHPLAQFPNMHNSCSWIRPTPGALSEHGMKWALPRQLPFRIFNVREAYRTYSWSWSKKLRKGESVIRCCVSQVKVNITTLLTQGQKNQLTYLSKLHSMTSAHALSLLAPGHMWGRVRVTYIFRLILEACILKYFNNRWHAQLQM